MKLEIIDEVSDKVSKMSIEDADKLRVEKILPLETKNPRKWKKINYFHKQNMYDEGIYPNLGLERSDYNNITPEFKIKSICFAYLFFEKYGYSIQESD